MWRFEKIKDLSTSKNLRQYLYPEGKKLQMGTTITRNNFADMLERIAYSGVEEFYTGNLGKEIVEQVCYSCHRSSAAAFFNIFL